MFILSLSCFPLPGKRQTFGIVEICFPFLPQTKGGAVAPFVSVYQIVSSNGEASTSLSAGTASAAPGLVTAIALATVAC